MNPKVIVGHERNISLLDYFEKLQLEYIVADLRQKIYRKQEDKDFYQQLKEKKKKKIEDIAERNHFPTIFNDEMYKRNARDKIFPEWGFPVFIYASQDQLINFQLKDITYYYYRGVDVRCNHNGKAEIGKIKYFDHNKEKLQIKLRNSGEIYTFDINDVSRIL